MQIEAVDLFCGVGGLTHGLINAGVRVLSGVDLDPACRYPFEANNAADFIQMSVADVTGDMLRPMFSKGAVRLLAGCAPCQPFSSYANGRDNRNNDKWGLLFQFARIVKELEPELVTMENVPQLSEQEPFRHFLATLQEAGYRTAWGVLACADYGVPQTRKRLVLVASKLGEVALPEKTHSKDQWVTAATAIGHLPPIADGETHSSDPLHKAAKMSPVNKTRIKASRPGGTWRDWPTALVAACHKKDSGKTYPSVYGRMNWDEPAPTMTTLCYGFGNGRFGHPEQNRGISLREAAIFQSFPEHYRFSPPSDPVVMKNVSRLI